MTGPVVERRWLFLLLWYSLLWKMSSGWRMEHHFILWSCCVVYSNYRMDKYVCVSCLCVCLSVFRFKISVCVCVCLSIEKQCSELQKKCELLTNLSWSVFVFYYYDIWLNKWNRLFPFKTLSLYFGDKNVLNQWNNIWQTNSNSLSKKFLTWSITPVLNPHNQKTCLLG